MTQDKWQVICIKRRLQEIGRRSCQMSFGLGIAIGSGVGSLSLSLSCNRAEAKEQTRLDAPK